MLTQIINARILTPQGWLKDGSVLIRDNKILEVTNCDLAIIGAKLIDAKGMYIVPGGVEIHVHGGGGRDFMEGTEDAFRTAIKAHMQHGTTSIFPTLSSSTIPMIRAAAETTEKMMAEPDSPVLGLHLEGHYFNMAMAGGEYQRSGPGRIYSLVGGNTLHQALGRCAGTSRSHAVRQIYHGERGAGFSRSYAG